MGMYTQLFITTDLKNDTPDSVIQILQYMQNANNERQETKPEIPDHPLFKTDRWDYMLICGSAYFEGPNFNKLKKKYQDNEASEWEFGNLSNFKNYDGEIDLFLDWLSPWISKSSCAELLGWVRYEEDDQPDLIYGLSGKLTRLQANCALPDELCISYKT